MPRVACFEAERRYRAELAAAAEGCEGDEGCVAFGTCYAITSGHAFLLQNLRSEAQEVCDHASETQVEMECPPRSVRCVAHRCVRF